MFNGKLVSKNFLYEDKDKIFINDYNYKNEIVLNKTNSLNFLNNALATGGFFLEISKDYKLKKPLVIYNNFSNSLKNYNQLQKFNNFKRKFRIKINYFY